MPELPEVQTIVDELRPQLLGRTFIGLSADWPATLATGSLDCVRRRLTGQRIREAGRRGKYILLSLSEGDVLLIHLMMSGRLYIAPGSALCRRHVHTRFVMDDGYELRFHDVRKLGRIHLVDDADQVIGHLGPEPLGDENSPQQFQEHLACRRGRLKSLLLNQRFLAGLGNIYADEVLFSAQLHPLRTADTLSRGESGRLFRSIRQVLRRALSRQGTTLRDAGYKRPDGRPGGYQDSLSVYGREGQPCPVCRTPIQRIVVGGRGTHFCPQCQSHCA
jgi:formamidopyrimidine-DNA glycosylase